MIKGSGSVSLTNAGSGRQKNIWILRIRIGNTGFIYSMNCSISYSDPLSLVMYRILILPSTSKKIRKTLISTVFWLPSTLVNLPSVRNKQKEKKTYFLLASWKPLKAGSGSVILWCGSGSVSQDPEHWLRRHCHDDLAGVEVCEPGSLVGGAAAGGCSGLCRGGERGHRHRQLIPHTSLLTSHPPLKGLSHEID